MKIVRGLCFFFVIACAGMLILSVYLMLFAEQPAPDSRAIEVLEAFQITEKYIASRATLPEQAEMDKWFENYMGSNNIVRLLMYERSGDKKYLPKLLGDIPEGSYLLAYWRNEWMEEYAPWSKKTTMCAIEKDCYSLSRNGFWIIFYLLLLIISFGIIHITKPSI